jgi:hypothetical protein
MGTSMYTRHQINEDTFAHRSLRWYCVLTDMAYLFSLRNSAIYIGMLTLPAQTSAHSFDHPPHPSDHRPSWSLCPLLQTLPPICSNPRLCYPSCHILGTYTRTRHLQLNTSSINRHSQAKTRISSFSHQLSKKLHHISHLFTRSSTRNHISRYRRPTQLH